MAEIAYNAKFGVYILTYPSDRHLSIVLIHSIRKLNRDVPIVIIPGEGLDPAHHPFDVPVMPPPAGSFWPQIGHQDRKFWAFQGPFETFLYLDADTICTGSLDPLIRRVARLEEDFILVQPWIGEQEWRSAIRDPSHPRHAEYVRHVGATVGRGPLARFDPGHDFLARYPFNTGVFASRRLAVRESDLARLNEAERAFYRDVLGLEIWSWRSSALFFRDQGRLNYLAAKLRIPVLPLAPDLICRAGASATVVRVAEVARGACPYHIVHWMGAKSPSPSFFCRGPLFRLYAHLWSFVGSRTGRWVAPGYDGLAECVGYSLWRRYREELAGRMALSARLAWSWADLRKTGRLLWRCLKLLAGAAILGLRGCLRPPADGIVAPDPPQPESQG